MRFKPSTNSRALMLGCALLAATSCSSDPAQSSGSGQPAGASASTTGADETETPSFFVGPLDAFLGYGGVPSPEDDAAADAQEQQVQEQIATCMEALGFVYEPYIPEYASTAWDLQSTMSVEDFARQYGYGMTTIDYPTEPDNPDPNDPAVDAMTPAERSAYYIALYGPSVSVDADGNPEFLTKPMPAEDDGSGPRTPVGCSAEASTAVYGSKERAPDDEFAALDESIGAMLNAVETDERVVEARSAWVDCMADAGHPGYTEKTDAPFDVSDRASELRGDADDYSAVDPAALQELRDYEIDVATADYTCGLAYDDVHETVQTELETRFIDENRDELERYRNALADGTAGNG